MVCALRVYRQPRSVTLGVFRPESHQLLHAVNGRWRVVLEGLKAVRQSLQSRPPGPANRQMCRLSGTDQRLCKDAAGTGAQSLGSATTLPVSPSRVLSVRDRAEADLGRTRSEGKDRFAMFGASRTVLPSCLSLRENCRCCKVRWAMNENFRSNQLTVVDSPSCCADPLSPSLTTTHCPGRWRWAHKERTARRSGCRQRGTSSDDDRPVTPSGTIILPADDH